MQTGQLAQISGFEMIAEGEGRPIASVYCADLLSWAMSRAPAGCAWCTVMGNINAVAVASLADVAAVILCEGAQLDADAKEKALSLGLCVACTGLPCFDAGVAVAKAAGFLGGKPA